MVSMCICKYPSGTCFYHQVHGFQYWHLKHKRTVNLGITLISDSKYVNHLHPTYFCFNLLTSSPWFSSRNINSYSKFLHPPHTVKLTTWGCSPVGCEMCNRTLSNDKHQEQNLDFLFCKTQLSSKHLSICGTRIVLKQAMNADLSLCLPQKLPGTNRSSVLHPSGQWCTFILKAIT